MVEGRGYIHTASRNYIMSKTVVQLLLYAMILSQYSQTTYLTNKVFQRYWSGRPTDIHIKKIHVFPYLEIVRYFHPLIERHWENSSCYADWILYACFSVLTNCPLNGLLTKIKSIAHTNQILLNHKIVEKISACILLNILLSRFIWLRQYPTGVITSSEQEFMNA
jgi:hypothetical protein